MISAATVKIKQLPLPEFHGNFGRVKSNSKLNLFATRKRPISYLHYNMFQKKHSKYIYIWIKNNQSQCTVGHASTETRRIVYIF